MPDPTQPAPKEKAMREIEQGLGEMKVTTLRRKCVALLAEVRRLQAREEAGRAQGIAAAHNYSEKCKEVFSLWSELTAVRAAVEEESKRADRAEAAARELRERLNKRLTVEWTPSDFREDCSCAMCRTAWLTGGNDGDSDN